MIYKMKNLVLELPAAQMVVLDHTLEILVLLEELQIFMLYFQVVILKEQD